MLTALVAAEVISAAAAFGAVAVAHWDPMSACERDVASGSNKESQAERPLLRVQRGCSSMAVLVVPPWCLRASSGWAPADPTEALEFEAEPVCPKAPRML